MSSWYSNLLTNASSNITKLQRTYFGGESDGDTDDDTHVCRVLRAYYGEKGQPLPGWLPPDPKAPQQQHQQQQQQQQQQSRYGAGGLGGAGGGGGGGASGLSSLWDNGGGGGDAAGGRPGLLGQRAGSYQPGGSGAISPAGSAASGVSAQEKLKQRLWGGAKTASPTAGGPFQAPGQQQGAGGGGGGGGGGGNRWGWGSGGSDGGSGDSGRSGKPVMSANAPWADGGFDYHGGVGLDGGGGGGGATGGGRRGYGLPSGPRGGLPSGPRPR